MSFIRGLIGERFAPSFGDRLKGRTGTGFRPEAQQNNVLGYDIDSVKVEKTLTP
jgi:hypothetical protein